MALSTGTIAAVANRIAKKLAWFVTNVADANATIAAGDVVITYDASDNYEPKYSTLAQITSGAASSAPVTITDAATYAVLAADSGKVHIFPNLTASCTATLPTAAAGLEYGRSELRSVDAIIANADALTMGTDPDFAGAFATALRAFIGAFHRPGASGSVPHTPQREGADE